MRLAAGRGVMAINPRGRRGSVSPPGAGSFARYRNLPPKSCCFDLICELPIRRGGIPLRLGSCTCAPVAAQTLRKMDFVTRSALCLFAQGRW